jgi:hypothetical protein
MWIPSHVGINGNEKADEAAFLATKKLTNNTIDKISSNEIFTSIKNKIFLSWQYHWDSISPNNKPPDFSRRQDIAITRIRICHSLVIH